MRKLTSVGKGWSFGIFVGTAIALSGCALVSVLREKLATVPERVSSLFESPEITSEVSPQPSELSLDNVRTRPFSRIPGGQVLDFGLTSAEPGIFFTVYSNGQVLAWEIDEGKPHSWLNLDSEIDTAAIHPLTATLALSKGESVWVIDLKSGTKRATLTRLRVRPTSLTVQADGKAVIIGGADGRIYRWKYIEEGQKATISEKERALERYIGHTSVVSALAAHPFGRVFFTGDWRGNFYAWLPLDSDPYSGQYDKSLFAGRAYTDTATSLSSNTFDKKGISNLTVSPDGNYLLIAGEAGMLELWAIRGFERVAHIQAHAGRIWSSAFSPDGRQIASVARDGMAQVFDIVQNPRYSSGSSLEKLRLTPKSQVILREGRKIFFRDETHLYVFTEQGELVEPVFSKVNPEAGAVVPTATPIPRAEANDY